MEERPKEEREGRRMKPEKRGGRKEGRKYRLEKRKTEGRQSMT